MRIKIAHIYRRAFAYSPGVWKSRTKLQRGNKVAPVGDEPDERRECAPRPDLRDAPTRRARTARAPVGTIGSLAAAAP